MRTIPDTIAATLAGNDPVKFMLMVTRATGSWTIEGATKTIITFSTHDLPSGLWGGFSQDYPGRVNYESFSAIVNGIRGDKIVGIGHSNQVTVKVSNHDYLYDTLQSDGVDLAGKYAFVYVWEHDGSGGVDLLLLHKGRIRDIQPDPDWLKITSEELYSVRNPLIPRNLYTPDTSIYDELHIAEELNGKPVPLVFGAHPVARGYTLADQYDDGSTDRGRLVQFFDPSPGTNLSAGEIGELTYAHEGLREACDGVAKIDTSRSSYTISNSNGWAYFNDNNPDKLYLYALVKFRSWATHYVSSTTPVNPKYALTDRDSEYTHIPGLSAGPTWSYLAYKVPTFGIDGTVVGDETDPELYWVVHAIPEDSSDWVSNHSWWGGFLTRTEQQGFEGSNVLNFERGRTSSTLARISLDNWDTDLSSGLKAYQLVETDSAVTWGDYDSLSDLSQCFCGFGVYSNSSSYGSGDLDVYHHALLVGFYIQWPTSDFYADVQGYKDGSGWYTGTSGSLIEHPAHLLLALLGGVSGIAHANIDRATFLDVATEYLPSGVFAGQIAEEQRELLDVVDEVAKEALLTVFIDENGLFTAFPAVAPNDSNIVDISADRIVGGALKRAQLTKIEDVKSSFVFRYYYHDGLRDFTRSLVCSSSDSSPELGSTYEAMCAEAEDEYSLGDPVSVTYDFKWVYDTATMAEIAKKLIERDTRRRWLVTWEMELQDIALEVGDAVRFSDAVGGWQWLPPSMSAKTFRVTSKKITPGKSTVEFTAQEVV